MSKRTKEKKKARLIEDAAFVRNDAVLTCSKWIPTDLAGTITMMVQDGQTALVHPFVMEYAFACKQRKLNTADAVAYAYGKVVF